MPTRGLSIEAELSPMETMIDERYRLLVLEHQVEGAEYKAKDNKWIFCCPLCSPFAKNKAKSKEKKGTLLWNTGRSRWVFCCHKCGISTTFYRFLMLVNQPMGRQYQRDRWHSGTTGKGFDCPDPK
jgi:hypothetical protein